MFAGGGAEFPVHVVCGPPVSDIPGGFLRMSFQALAPTYGTGTSEEGTIAEPGL